MFFSSIIIFMANAADQEQDRRQTCLLEGLSAEFAGCEALRASRQADGIRSVVAGSEATGYNVSDKPCCQATTSSDG